MKRRWMFLLVLVVVFVFSGVVNASLIEIGTATYGGTDYKLIYEDNSIYGGLVWLDYTRGYDTWQNQVNWASGLGSSLTVTLDPGYTTTIDWSTGWRLPATDETQANLWGGYGWEGPNGTGYHNCCYGYNMVNSEMGHLYYETLGNLGYLDTDGNVQSGYGLQNTGHFDNLQAAIYRSGTMYSRNSYMAWIFDFNKGNQWIFGVLLNGSALAVRPGDVSIVPIPGTALLLTSGLAGFGVFRKRIRGRRR